MRLNKPVGLYIDRDKPVSFRFDGCDYTGFYGDTISSALAANGVRVLSRSFKYHRPRGIFTMTGEDANTLVQVGEEPNVRADTRLIEDGLVVTPQNVFGSLTFDFAGCIGWFSRFLPVGFYYKTFYKPKGIWKVWEPIIRRMAGLGKVDMQAQPQATDKVYRFADVAVIGAGPAGMNAALEAATNGAEVLLIEENPLLGGSLNYARFGIDRSVEDQVRTRLTNEVKKYPNIHVLTNAQCTGWFADNWLAIVCAQRLIKLRAKVIVAATGSLEQPAVFRNNDLPGIMLGSAAQRLIQLYGVSPGKRTVVLTANEDGYGVALDLVKAGVGIEMVIDMRPERNEISELVQTVINKNIEIIYGHTVYEAIPESGNRSIKAVLVDGIEAEGKVAGQPRTIPCDLLCISVGYTPVAQLLCHSGGRLVYDTNNAILIVDQLPSTTSAVAAGSLNSVFQLDAVLADGKKAGGTAAMLAGFDIHTVADVPQHPGPSGQNYPWPIFPHPKGKDFVDLDEDLQIKDIIDAVAEGYDDLELIKRYSTVVMGPSQGKQSALNNLRIATRAAANSLDDVTVTTQRPPFHPEPIQLLAGRSFQPVRRTAMHHRHLETGAQMVPAGLWMRPAYYGSPEQRKQLIEQETMIIRNNVGLIDVSTLGKLDIRGADAAEFMDRIYTYAYKKQAINRSRYVLMTNETGAIIDDGVACRLGQNHFYVTATTGGVDNIYRSMLRWNAEWQLDVDIANVTSAYAGINLAGPKSREVLQKLTDSIDISAKEFAYMQVKTGDVAGIPARLLRVGFVGELAYEIHVPSSQGEAIWDALMQAGQSSNIQPCGIEAQRLLRLEKGHLIVGQDTDGLTMPQEAAMGWAIARKKPFFVGKRVIDIFESQLLRRKLVGFTLQQDSLLPEECHLTVRGDEITGRVTSIDYSPTLKHAVGLAYVAPDQSDIDSQFEIKMSDGQRITATVSAIPFYDPEGQRQEL